MVVYKLINDEMVELINNVEDDEHIVSFEDLEQTIRISFIIHSSKMFRFYLVNKDLSMMVLLIMFVVNVFVDLLQLMHVLINYTVQIFVVVNRAIVRSN